MRQNLTGPIERLTGYSLEFEFEGILLVWFERRNWLECIAAMTKRMLNRRLEPCRYNVVIAKLGSSASEALD
jgi:hypothetical protein